MKRCLVWQELAHERWAPGEFVFVCFACGYRETIELPLTWLVAYPIMYRHDWCIYCCGDPQAGVPDRNPTMKICSTGWADVIVAREATTRRSPA